MCLTPITLKIPGNSCLNYLYPSGFMLVPCGHCIECQQQQTNSWAARICEEFKDYGTAIFFTLTYRDSISQRDLDLAKRYHYSSDDICTIPKCVTYVDPSSGSFSLRFVNRNYDPKSFTYCGDPSFIDNTSLSLVPYDLSATSSVCHEDIQLWLKRYREHYFRDNGFRCPVRYFITEEYGPRTQRPHYHGVLFGLSMSEARDLFRDWQVRYGYVRYEVARDKAGCGFYVAKYCSKGQFENPLCSHFSPSVNGKLSNYYHDSFPFVIHKYGYNCPLCFRCRKFVSQGLGASYLTKEKIEYHLGLDNKNDLPIFEQLFKLNPRYVDGKSKLQWLPQTTDKWRIFTQSRCIHAINQRRYYNFSQGARLQRDSSRANGEVTVFTSSSRTKKTLLPQYYLHRLCPSEIFSILSVDIYDMSRKMAEEKYRQLSPDTPLWSDNQVCIQLLEIERAETQDRIRKTLQCNKNFYNKAKL